MTTNFPLPNSSSVQDDPLYKLINTNSTSVQDNGYNPNVVSSFVSATNQANGQDADSDAEEDGSDGEESSPLIKAGQKYQSLQSNPTPNKQPLGQTLQSLLGANAKELGDAQSQRNQLQLMAMLGKAGETIGNALTPYAPHPQDNSMFQAQMAMAQQPVQNIQEEQALSGGAVKNLASLSAAQNELALNDPNSQASISARQLYQKTSGQQLDPSVSAAQIMKLQPVAEGIYKADQNKLMKQMMIQNQTSNKQNQSFSQTQQLLESARGNPAAQQAERDLYAANKAKSLINLYGDPNKLNDNMVNLLSTEVAKIAGGGVPTLEGLKAVTPETVNTKFSSVVQKLINKPTPANAGAFIKQYGDYIHQLENDAQKVISDKYGRIINSRKNQLNDDQYNALKDQYLDRFKTQSPAASSSKDMVQVISPTGVPGTIPKAKLDQALQRGFKLSNG